MSVSKRTRFETFKRDLFTYQYCGRKSPAVVLHVDHIEPVSLGGKDDLENLVTSCADCNLSKSNVPLERKVQPIENQIKADSEKMEQILAYEKFLVEKRNRKKEQVAIISKMVMELQEEDPREFCLTEEDTKTVDRFLELLPCTEILEAVQIAHNKKDFVTQRSATWRYFCGVCWKKARGE